MSREYDEAFGEIVSWLDKNDLEALSTSRDDFEVRPSRNKARRAAQPLIDAAEAKRLRKAEKLRKLNA